MRIARSVLRVLLVVALGSATLGAGAFAQETSGPTLTVDRAEVAPGAGVVVRLEGWRTKVVTLSVCGNLALRGSSDCNIVASEGIGLRRDAPESIRDFYVNPPPTTCPCVLRASSATNDEVAVAPIVITGHPVGPLVYPTSYEPLEVGVHATRAPRGLLEGMRAMLGGPTTYEVEISVRNQSTERLTHVALAGSARRGRSDVDELRIPEVGTLDAGQTWTHTVRSTLPAPAVGTFTFGVTASGAGPAVGATTTTRSVPPLLLLLVAIFIVDVAAIVWRRRALAKVDRNVSARARRRPRPVQPVVTGPS